jgi:hypothetical protein
MNSKDQEKIYKLYEDFKNIESTQPSANLANVQHPNYSPHLSTSGTWRGITGPSKPDRLTPEQEEGESKFKYRDEQGNVFSLIKVVDEVAHLRDKRVGAIIKIPISKLSRVLKEI